MSFKLRLVSCFCVKSSLSLSQTSNSSFTSFSLSFSSSLPRNSADNGSRRETTAMRTPTTVNLYLQNPLPVLFPTPKLVSSNSKPNFLNFISKNGNRGFSGQFTAKLAGIRPRPMRFSDKLVYFSTNSDDSSSSNESLAASNGDRGRPVLERQLHFAKFETQKINDCIDFIQSKQLRLTGSEQHGASGSTKSVIKAIGGGAFKYADLFKEKLGISLERQMKWTVLWPEQIFCLSSVVVIILGYLLALLLIQLEPL